MFVRRAGFLLFVLVCPTRAQPPPDEPLPAVALARFGIPRSRHVGSQHVEKVTAVALSPDGKALATTKGHFGALLWSATTGEAPRKLNIPGIWLYGLAFSPDGKRLAYVANDGAVLNGVFDLTTNNLVWKAPGGTFVAFLPDGKLLASNALRQPALRDAATGKVIRAFGITGEGWRCCHVALARDGKTLAALHEFYNTRSYDGKILLSVWDVATGKERFKRTDSWHPSFGRPPFGKLAPDTSLALSPDGKTLVLAYHGLLFLDVATGKEIRRIDKGKLVVCFNGVFSPDGKRLACFEAHTDPKASTVGTSILLLDADSGKERGRFDGNTTVGDSLAFSADGNWLVCAGRRCAVWVRNVSPRALARDQEGHRGTVQHVCFTADSKTLVSCDPQIDVRWWDLTKRRQTARLELGGLKWLDLFADGKALAVVESAQRVRVVDAGGKARFTVAEWGTRVRCSPDGKQLVWSGYDGVLHLLDAATGKALRQFKGHTGPIRALAFSGDGRRLLSAGRARTEPWPRIAPGPPPPEVSVRLWDVATGKQLRLWKDLAVECADLSPDGQTVAAAYPSGEVVLLDVATGKLFRRLRGNSPPSRVLAFAPDGRSLAVGGDDWLVSWWETATGQERRRFPGHTAPVEALAFAPNGKALASGSADTTVVVWDCLAATGDQRPLKELWADLRGDAHKFHGAVGHLLALPKDTLAFIERELKPIPAIAARRLEDRVADLDSPKFAVRQKAVRDLERWQEQTEPHLRRAMEGKPSLEMRRRVELLLARLEAARFSPPAEEVQALRMLEVLEHLGTPEARALLEVLVAGAPEARRTRGARAALGRLRAIKQ